MNNTGKSVVVLVDAYPSSFALAKAFMDEGCDVVRVQSTVDVPKCYQGDFDTSAFSADIVHRGVPADTAAAVAEHRPVAVIAAGEYGVELADELSEELGLPTNGRRLSPARRDKFVMIETIRAAGLRAARQLLVEDERSLTDWHREVGGRVVVKPLRSAANDGVAICDTPEESAAALRGILGRTTVFSETNTAAVVQEYLVGGEYVVDTVSRDGRHRVTDVWKYSKMSVPGVRDRITGGHLVPGDSPVRQALVDYASDVLDALGILHGPAHLEIIVTADGPCLVEVGARMAGANTPYYAELGAGESQIGWTVEAYLRPERFLAEYRRPYRFERHVSVSWPTAPQEGRLVRYPLLDVVKGMESFNNVETFIRPGEVIVRTVDDSTKTIAVGFAHSSAEVVERDFHALCYLDGPGFYDVEQTA
ncbi:ATP-grasp domain-containing protein [Streptomyces xanthophaeus]|uniref:ATP-grasp domain-containing protein n=1 Tax=Streptomyces xanthophaeus TaxID=67385 RepID=UPI002649B390|nr:ATP-grasp domain-containing protein [Streptomyces xanthophaeus]WKD33857.1 ATP-grasp domain-containing protein [Streptomyces xanthophaeus]